jgi:hypothetical protein
MSAGRAYSTLRRFARKLDDGFLFVTPEEAGHLADGLDRLSPESTHNFILPGAAGFPIAPQFYFHQFMVIQCRIDLSQNVFAQSLVCDNHNGLEMMGQTPEVAALAVVKRHVVLPDVVNWVVIRGAHSITQGKFRNGEK